ncbi:MAG: GNAT family N-acetyltransferase [Pseudomonadota bacterium]
MAEFRHETDRLILRDWREEDWPLFFEGTNTPRVMEWLGGVMDEEGMVAARERLERYQRDFGHTFWPVVRKDDKAILGFCGLKRCTDENGPFGMMEAGWRLREEAWGRGYAKEAAIATLNLAFGHFDANEVIAITVKPNLGSWGLMERLSMERRRDLDFEDVWWSKDYGAAIVYLVTKEIWRARKR